FCGSLPFQQVTPIHVERLAIPEYCNNQRQADGGLRSGDNEYKEHKDLPADLTVLGGERHKREVDRIEHDFDRQQQSDNVAFGEETQHADQKQDCAEDQVPSHRNHKSFLAKTTAPMRAIKISSDVASNGNRKSVNRLRPIASGLPLIPDRVSTLDSTFHNVATTKNRKNS